MTYRSKLARYRARNRAYNAFDRSLRFVVGKGLDYAFPGTRAGTYFNWAHKALSKEMDENPTEVPEIISDPWGKTVGRKGSNPAPNIGSNRKPNIGSNQFGQVRRFHYRRARRRAGVKLIPRFKRRKR